MSPLFDQMYFDQKWSVWDSWKALVEKGRNLRAYAVTTAYRMGDLITGQKRQANAVTTQKRRGNIITGV